MIIDTVSIDIQRTGDTAALRLQGKPFGYNVRLTLAQLDGLIAEFIQVSSAWRRAQEPDYYAILDVSRDASDAQIKNAYRTLAKQHHPDGQVGNEEVLKAINAAYEILGDAAKRKQYDATSI